MRGSRGDDLGMIVPDLPSLLRGRACPAGELWTGGDPAAHHGHTDCWIFHMAADEIERLTAELSKREMECRQWRQAVDMATRRAVAAEESLKPPPRVSPSSYTSGAPDPQNAERPLALTPRTMWFAIRDAEDEQ